MKLLVLLTVVYALLAPAPVALHHNHMWFSPTAVLDASEVTDTRAVYGEKICNDIEALHCWIEFHSCDNDC